MANINYNVPIYSKAIKEEQYFVSNPFYSGSLKNNGLYLEDDTSNPSGSTLNNLATLVDWHYSTPVVTGGNFNSSIGIDLGKARTVSKLNSL